MPRGPRYRVAEEERLQASEHFPGVVPRSPGALMGLAGAALAIYLSSSTKNEQLPNFVPLELRTLVIEEMRKLGTLSDRVLRSMLTLTDGTPRLPRALVLRNCLFVTDGTLKMIADLFARESPPTLMALDLRGCPNVTVRAVYELFGTQISDHSSLCGMGRSRQATTPVPSVRVELLPLPVLFATEADRLVAYVPTLLVDV